MADYKVIKVSQQAPREYGEGDRKTYYINVMLEGHNRPVSIGKKSPHAISVGDVVSGEITATPYDSDKFTAERKQFGFNKPDHDKQNQIKAQWAIGRATEWVLQTTQDFNEIEPNAVRFFGMVERVSKGTPTVAPPAVTEKKPDVVAEVPDEEINLDDIPF